MIGNQLASNIGTDPQSNVLMRMVDWVENGNAPETITGVKYVDVSTFFSSHAIYLEIFFRCQVG